ncbi:UNVERIFIED_CONTAM: SNARE-interacting protein KEULE [Sesamum angustifolium]|uniref:SNARE-interacting protein KEULE n=1 Tax=Sesamum angustifolium TaxID=2727405 RepID=A0AAW2MKI2_9LAMI
MIVTEIGMSSSRRKVVAGGVAKYTTKVLVMDKVTVKVMSYACKMADINEEGVSSLLIHKMCWETANIFSIVIFLSDMSGGSALYRKAFVFFSSPIAKELVSDIKGNGSVLSRIGALREGFVTDNERVLEELFGNEESSRKGDACLNLMATRIATVFASLREFPFVRYRAAKSLDAATMTTFRDLIPTKLAAAVWNCLMKYKNTLPDFPPSETCELLILDRSIDQLRVCHKLSLKLKREIILGSSSLDDPPQFIKWD